MSEVPPQEGSLPSEPPRGIPDVSAERIRAAAREFDANLRGASEWTGWEANRAHHWSLELKGSLYPVKQIIRMATDGYKAFAGGPQANGYLIKRGFTI